LKSLNQVQVLIQKMRIIWEWSLKICMNKKTKWRPHGRNSPTWIFLVLMINQKLMCKSHKLCIVCYEKSISLAILMFRPKK
jgi:hypothetical protein